MGFNDPSRDPIRASGTGNMGTVTDSLPSVAFGLPADFYLDYLRVWFSGGTGTGANLALKQKLRYEPSGWYDREVRNFPNSGTDDVDFIYFRVDADERDRWAFAGGDLLVPEWINPDSGNMRWAFEAGLSLID